MDKYGRITREDTALILIDVQEKFEPHIHGMAGVAAHCVQLVRGCRELGIPILVTEQYTRGLGPTLAPVREALGGIPVYEKMAFSIFEDQNIADAVRDLSRSNLLLAGVEAHVCLIQSALDAMHKGYTVHWITDAISSRTPENAAAAATRAAQCGAFTASTEMALFQMLGDASDPAFKTISNIVK
jgi:nicotinamidase-related amidase